MMMNSAPRSAGGFSLIELMIAMTLGLLLLSGLALIFVNSSEANRELQKTAQQIENGRFALDVISQDLRLAGFYGHLHDFSNIPTPGTIPPDPCEDSDTVELRKSLRYPVQGYRGTLHATNPASNTAPTLPAGCAAYLTAANLKAGSDVLIIRRADTNYLRRPGDPGPDPTAPATPANGDPAVANMLYVQASATDAEIQVGGGGATGGIMNTKADGTASALYLNNVPASPPASPVRRFRVHIYFVAPCSVGAGAGGLCTGAAGEDTIPTLKRLELTSTSGFTIVPLVEGIEHFKVEYGVDDTPNAVNLKTGLNGDSSVDRYEIAPSGNEWENVVAAKIYLLARNTEPTTGFTDDKTYRLGSAAATDNITVPVAAGADARFKRHVYAATVQMINPAGRRDIP